MRLYWEVARRGFRRYATYRAATLAGLFTNTIFGFIRAYIFIALFTARPRIGNFGLKDALTYSFLTQGLIAAIQFWGWFEIEERIKSGQIATDLLRPYRFLAYWQSYDLGRAAYQLLTRGVPPFVVGAIFFTLRLPQRPSTWMFLFLSIVVAVVVSFALRVMANMASFWLLDSRGVMGVLGICWMFFSGFIVPIAIFPNWLKKVAYALPFPATFNIPAEIFLEKVTGAELIGALGFQAAWAVVLLLSAQWVLSRGTRKLVIQGG